MSYSCSVVGEFWIAKVLLYQPRRLLKEALVGFVSMGSPKKGVNLTFLHARSRASQSPHA